MTSVTLQQSCEFPARVFLNANPKWPVTVACSTFFGVAGMENIWCVFREKPPFTKFVRRSVDWDKEILQTLIKRTMNIVPWCIAEHSHYVMYDHGLNHHLIFLCNFYKILIYVRPNFSVRSKQIEI